MKLRLIPVLLAAAVLLLGLKVTDVWEVVRAQTAGQAAPAAAAPEGATPATESSTESDTAQSPLGSKGKESAVPAADPLMMSPSEIDVLQKLSERRATLDRRAQEMSQQEVVLKAAEQRVDEKLAKLKSMEQEIGGLVDQETKQGDERLKGLVKIYETMKPREAARIFEELDTPTVLDVLGQMKEAKAAPILASMDPVKAKTVTAALIERRQQPGTHAPTKAVSP
jgi:flagellar motility protein MotE (MotC chaperone)